MPSASWTGRPRIGPQTQAALEHVLPRAPIPSRATAPAWASCAWPRVHGDDRLEAACAAGHRRSSAVPTAALRRFSSTAWSASPPPPTQATLPAGPRQCARLRLLPLTGLRRCSTIPPQSSGPTAPDRHGQGPGRTAQTRRRLALTFEERLGLLVDREVTERETARPRRLHRARLKQTASPRTSTTATRAAWTGPCCAACSPATGSREPPECADHRSDRGRQDLPCLRPGRSRAAGLTALYVRLPRLLPELAIARADGRLRQDLAPLAKTDVLVLDDWGLATSTASAAATCWRSSMTVTDALDPGHQPAAGRPLARRPRRSRPSPMPSSTAWSIRPMPSPWSANRCASSNPD